MSKKFSTADSGSSPLTNYSVFDFDFSVINLPSAIAHLECGFDRMHRWQNFFKRLAGIEEEYAKDMMKLVEEYRNEDQKTPPIPSASAPASGSAELFRAIFHSIEKVAGIHTSHAGDMRNYIATPMRSWRKDHEPAKNKLQKQAKELIQQQKDLRDSVIRERSKCIQTLLVYKDHHQNDPDMLAVDNEIRRLPAEKQSAFQKDEAAKKLSLMDRLKASNKPVDTLTLQTQFRQFNENRKSAYTRNKRMYSDEAALLKEMQALEEERLAVLVEFFGKHSKYYNSGIVKALQDTTKDFDDKHKKYELKRELRSSTEITMMTHPRDVLAPFEYGKPSLNILL